jgi:tetratricopeptide (TPR) repeat protein
LTTAERGLRTAETNLCPSEPERLKSEPQALSSSIFKRRSSILVLATLASLFIAATAAWFYLSRRPVLTSTDTILLADFENKTGEEIFEGTLRQGLAIQLSQTPFLQLFPATQIRQTLRLMARSASERITGEVAREICIRQNLKAFVTGSIAPFGRHYVITLEAIKGESGEVLAHEQVEAESKEKVMSALSQAARRLRGKLGESLSSIERFHKPLEEATTADLEAWRFYTQGQQLAISGRVLEAIPFYERAAEIDPNFGSAYSHLAVFYWVTGRPALAADRAEKAYKLRDRLTEQEKLRLTFRYHVSVTGDLNKAIEVATLIKRMYPRWSVPVDLAMACDALGKSDEVILEARESIRLLPQFDFPYRLLAKALLRLNRFAEAKDVLAMAPQQRLDTRFHSTLYQIALIDNDTAGMQQQVERARGKPDEHVAFEWQAASAAFVGQWRKAQERSRHAIQLAPQADTKEVAAGYAAEQALRLAVLSSNFSLTPPQQRKLKLEVKTLVQSALSLARGRASLPSAAMALALCGQTDQAKPLVDELTKRYPQDTIINSTWLPVIRAMIELQRGNAAGTIEQLQTASRYEAAAEFWPQYLRGEAYLNLKQGTEAATEFQKILDHRGQAPLSVLYPMAHLGLARAAALAGDTAKSRTAFEDFFKTWKSADADLSILIEAKKEYQRSGQCLSEATR